MSYAEERLQLLPHLRTLSAGRALGDAFLLDQRSLRFHLGTSLADLRVPVAVDPQLIHVFETAAVDLFHLLCIRHRAVLREEDWDRLLLLDGFDSRAGRPVSFSAPAQIRSENVRSAFFEAPELLLACLGWRRWSPQRVPTHRPTQSRPCVWPCCTWPTV